MDIVNDILGCFVGKSCSRLSTEETFTTYTVEAEGQVIPVVEVERFQEAVARLPSVEWTLSVHLEGQDSPHSFASKDLGSVEEAMSDLAYGVKLSSQGRLKLIVTKRIPCSTAYVFDPPVLFRWLSALEVRDALLRFDELVRENALVSFINPSFDENCSTRLFRFVRAELGEVVDVSIANERQELFETRRDQIVSDWSTLKLFPDDFRWIGAGQIEALTTSFARLENFLGVVSLANTTLSTTDGFSVSVKGHVPREQTLTWAQVPTKPDIALRNLFAWCYRASGAGPVPDKLGLVRNFMSHYWDHGVFGQELRVVAAVRSGYELYLKKNLKEFVELRSKVAAFIFEIDGKAAKAIETVMGNLEKNFYGLTTFITSVVLIKVLQDKTFGGAFTEQLAVLGYALILISAIHAVFARASALKEMERAKVLYDDLRQLYSAFFSLSDFDAIFRSGDQSPIEKTESYVRSRLLNLLLVWFGTLFIAVAVIYVLRNWN